MDLTLTPGSADITVEWEQVSNAVKYLIEVKTSVSGQPGADVDSVEVLSTADPLQGVVGGLSASTAYFVRVTPYNGVDIAMRNNDSEWEGFTTDAVLGVVLTTDVTAAANVPLTGSGIAYSLNIENQTGADVTITSITVPCIGTYHLFDINHFRIWKNTSSSGTFIFQDSVNNGPFSKTCGISALVPATSSIKLIVTIVVDPSAVIGRTFGVDGTAGCTLVISGTPPQQNNQSNNSGLLTITS